MKIRRDKGVLFEIVLGVLAVVAIAGAIVVHRSGNARAGVLSEEVRRLTAYSADLEKRIAEIDEPQSGGAETRGPAPRTISEEWTFPIAETDYLMMTSPFGYRVSPILEIELYHEGVDIAATWRAQVVAVADGEVVEHWPAPDGYFRGHDVYGGMVVVEHAEGWRSRYAHLYSTRVHTGQVLRAGDVIGRVGGTGKSRGEHLHFELRSPDGAAVNPLLFVSNPKERSEG